MSSADDPASLTVGSGAGRGRAPGVGPRGRVNGAVAVAIVRLAVGGRPCEAESAQAHTVLMRLRGWENATAGTVVRVRGSLRLVGIRRSPGPGWSGAGRP